MSPEVEALRTFVAEYFDGSLARCMELDELLWQVRLANRHEPQMLHYDEVPVAKPPKGIDDLLADIGL
jgi:hypothetical protein